MPNLGTRKFWRPFTASKGDENANQILKNTGYVSIILHSAFYNSTGNFWQKIFGGTDKIALTSTISYKSTDKSIESKAIQDKRTLKANRNYFLGLSRLVALKVPSTADGLELKINLTAVKDDNFEAGLNLLNSPEFQVPLQVAPVPIGQIVAITSIVKKLFTGVDEGNEVEATFAGIISRDKVESPAEKERLVEGYLIMIDNNDENSDFFKNIDQSKFTVEGDGLKYNNKEVTKTYIVYTITFESLKGIDETSTWNKKYQEALLKLDDLYSTQDEEAKKKILSESRAIWIDGSAILFDDVTYLFSEKNEIKAAYFKKINERYKEITSETDETFLKEYLLSDTSELISICGSNLGISLETTFKIAADYLHKLGEMGLVMKY